MSVNFFFIIVLIMVYSYKKFYNLIGTSQFSPKEKKKDILYFQCKLSRVQIMFPNYRSIKKNCYFN